MSAAQWLEVILSFSLQVVLLITACSLLERRVQRNADRAAVWNTCFLAVLLLGVGAALLPRLHLLHPWAEMDSQAVLRAAAAQTVLGSTLFVTWCLGAAFALGRWMLRAYWLRRAVRHCERLSDEQARALLASADVRPACGAQPIVLVSDEVDGPFCWQLHRPTIVLPRFLVEGGADDLRHVLLHEIEHLKTNHPLHLFLQHVTQVVCWFHPSVWGAGSMASLVRELTCDEAAARQGAGSVAYLRTLLHIAERCEQGRQGTVIGFSRMPSEIVQRARRLVELAKTPEFAGRRGGLGRRAASLAVLLSACLLSLVWIPMDPLASPRAHWSPWPTWTATALHCFGCNLRDYEPFDRRTRVFELERDQRAMHDPRARALAGTAQGSS